MIVNDAPLVSIITICYNSEATIEQTIQQVLAQTYSNIEYIIIDGGSKDSTLRIIDKYKSKISVIVSEPDKGIYDAMNKGINRANGELIGIINSDDWYEVYTVEKVINHYLTLPSASNTVIYGMIRLWKENKEFAIRRFHHNFLHETVIQHPTCFVPKTLYVKYGSFNSKYRIAGDYDLLNRFAENNVVFSNIDVVLANFRIGGASTKLSYIGAIEYLKIKREKGFIANKTYRWRIFRLRLGRFVGIFRNMFS